MAMKRQPTARARRKESGRLIGNLLNPKKMILLFLTGFVLGMVLISLGWADTPTPHKKHHSKRKAHSHVAVHKHKHKVLAHHARTHKNTALAHRHTKTQNSALSTQIASQRQIHDAPIVTSRVYMHPEGQYKFRYPEGWQVNTKDNAMIVKSPGDVGVFGIVRRPDDQPNKEAVKKEFQASDRPADLTQTPANVAGLSATKVIGSKKDDPYTRMVEYYVQSRKTGHQYYILLMAPQNQWNRYSISFNNMMHTLSFN
jgi:predicted Zn-dependent protease